MNKDSWRVINVWLIIGLTNGALFFLDLFVLDSPRKSVLDIILCLYFCYIAYRAWKELRVL